ncbi:MAG: hypothetical protein JSR82_01840 [Verrucomicrobia bacterium]|nr:hypothetical protein [Verrucomicrobiota bacterium]
MRLLDTLGLVFALILAALGCPAAGFEPNPEGDTGVFKPTINSAGSIDPHSGNASRMIEDLKVPGAVGDYGLNVVRYWESLRYAQQQDTGLHMPYAHGGWTNNWALEAAWSWDYNTTDDPNPYILITLTLNTRDGRVLRFNIKRLAANFPNGVHADPPFLGHPPGTLPASYVETWSQAHAGDYIGAIHPNGLWFWLMCKDGGAILYELAPGAPGPDSKNVGSFRATEIRDPHGVPTRLTYNGDRLVSATEAAGRTLRFTWGTPTNAELVLTAVSWHLTPSDPNPVQTVNYGYGSTVPDAVSAVIHTRTVLASASTTGDTRAAAYTYRFHTPSSTTEYPQASLYTADDPRFAGPMQRIRYRYRGQTGECPAGNPNSPFDNSKSSNYRPAYHAVEEEQTFDGTMVARLEIPCNGLITTGLRFETTGLNQQRTFYYGSRAEVQPPNGATSWVLYKATDYTNNPASAAKQIGSNPPSHTWDHRGTESRLQYSLTTRKVTELWRYGADGSKLLFDYSTPGASLGLAPDIMQNWMDHWVFSKTDELGRATTYVRDGQRLVTKVIHPAQVAGVPIEEHYTYDGDSVLMAKRNPVTNAMGTELVAIKFKELSHTLPSGTVETKTYGPRHLLSGVWNSQDGATAGLQYTYYTYGEAGGYADLLKTVSTARSRAANVAFAAQFEYDSSHRITKVTYPATEAGANPFVAYQYDDYGNCTQIIDELGHWKRFQYDEYGRCTQMEEQLDAPGYDGGPTVASRFWNWIYDRVNYPNPLLHTSKQWRVQIEPSFNAAGRRRMTVHYFDANDRVTAVQTGWTSNAAGGNWIAEPEMATSYAAYDAQGNKTSTTDPLGRVTSMTYDLRNRPVTVTDPLLQTTTTSYDLCGNKTLITFHDGKTQQFQLYDAFGQAWRTIDERNNPTDLTYQWGPMKKLATVITYRDKDAGGTENQVTTFQYDGMGREWKRWFPDGTWEENYYNLGGELSSHRVRRGLWQTFTRDARARETGSSWDNAAQAGLQPVVKVWDKANRLTSISNDVSTITYSYDAAGQVWTENNNIAGGPSGGRTQTYHRYGNGAVSRLGYPCGTWFQRNYNARGELISLVQVSPGNPSWSWTAAEFFYYADGKPSWTNRGNGASSRYFYDGKGNLSVSEHFQALGGFYYAGGSTVLTAGQALTRGRYYFTLQGDGNLVLYENGVPRWATGTNNGAQLVMQTDGNLVLYTAGGSAAWATWTQGNPGAQFVFQEDGNLVVYAGGWQTKWHSNTAGQMAGSVARRDYSRDNRDRIVAASKGTVSGNSLENGRSDRFVYDAEGQLTDAYYDAQYASGPVSGQAREDHFVYDQLGNRKANDWLAFQPGWLAWTRRDNGLNQVQSWLGGLPANYDSNWNIPNGNLIQDGNFTAWYNALNQPMWSATTATPQGYANFYAYDPLGRCVKRWYALNNPTGAAVANNPATYFYYEGWSLIEEADGNATLAQIYLHGARVDEIVARYRYADAKWYFHHYDGRTHCQVVTTNNAAVAEQYQYDAFGWPYLYTAAGAQLTLVNGRPASAIGNRFLFTGREWLTDWGVYDYRHRQYHPGMGRFVQPDPKHFGAGDYNLYRYCHNDPVNHTDPSGLITIGIVGYGPGQRDRGGNYSNEVFARGVKGVDPEAKIFSRNEQKAILKAIRDARAGGDNVVNLFGYSRGAYAAIQVANALGKEGIGVDNLTLLDPVRLPYDRMGNPLPIPGNVKAFTNFWQSGSRMGIMDFPGTPTTRDTAGSKQDDRAPAAVNTPQGVRYLDVRHENIPYIFFNRATPIVP